MKCLHCRHDSKYRARRGRRCPRCGKAFALEPRDGDPMTDAAFQASIDAVSAGGSLRWGVEHLYYEVCRRRPAWRPGGGCAGTLLLLFVIAAGLYAYWQAAFWGWTALVFGTVLLMVLHALLTPPGTLPITRKKFDRMWHRWQQAHGLPEGVIIRRAPASAAESAREPAADVSDYSFDRAVICDRARTVDLLLANNFHFEHNCAVLSVHGYPPHAFDTVRTMLRRNPRLEVYALHDATLAGCTLPARLKADPDWFQGLEVTDVGLRPEQARAFGRLLRESTTRGAARDRSLDPRDARWLAKHSLELAALRPEQIIRAVHRAMYPLARGRDGSDSFG